VGGELGGGAVFIGAGVAGRKASRKNTRGLEGEGAGRTMAPRGESVVGKGSSGKNFRLFRQDADPRQNAYGLERADLLYRRWFVTAKRKNWVGA